MTTPPSERYEELALPLSGHQLQWRPESSQWRILSPSDPEASWLLWDPNTEQGVHASCKPQTRRPDEPWWLIYGVLRSDTDTIAITTDDETQLEIRRVGPLYAVEWSGWPHLAVVRRGGQDDITLDLAGMGQRRKTF